ncbi:hypothetical protein WJX74_007536 [Apatococcus lobatus]|uniref:tRNA threonylcarbamoyladenosine biosynthesis protein TsaE n=1 Tax=Apatococcus lobatus TaxID=904363 RepID=A0AAW1QZT6_9CHLO
MLKIPTSGTLRASGYLTLRKIAPRVSCSGQAYTIHSGEEGTTQTLASKFAQHLLPGDTYLLTGPVGAGKSVFSRAFIRAAYEDDILPVPSPTYLLQNIYDELEGPDIHHFDLYRLDGTASLGRLQLDQSFRDAVSLVEWAERLPSDMLPANRLDIHITPLEAVSGSRAGDAEEVDESYTDDRHREIKLIPYGSAMAERCQAILARIL